MLWFALTYFWYLLAILFPYFFCGHIWPCSLFVYRNSFTLTIVTVNIREGNVSLNGFSNAGLGVAERVSLKRDEIVHFLSTNVNPERLADKFRVAGLINDDIRWKALVTTIAIPERIRPMIDAIITRIELNVANYDTFISVLREFKSLEDFIQFIERPVQ